MDYEDEDIGNCFKNSKTDEVSNKLAMYLIKGWCMLEESCQDCNCPLMQGKQRELVCCGCERDYSQQNNSKTQNNVSKPQDTKKRNDMQDDDSEEIIVTKRKDSYKERHQNMEELPENICKLGKTSSTTSNPKPACEKSILKTPSNNIQVSSSIVSGSNSDKFSANEVLKAALTSKLEWMCGQLDNQTDLTMITKYLDTIEKMVKMLKLLK